jgi:hypothetical protein
MTILCNCSKPEQEIVYHPNGKIRFEVPLKNGKRHGRARGYFESGKLQGEVEYVNGKEEGTWYELDEFGHLIEKKNYHNGRLVGWDEIYHSSGVLLEKTFFDSLGRPQDFRKYKRNGERDLNFISPILYTIPDSVKLGNVSLFFARLGNADSTKISKGYLLITSGFDSLKNHAPLDTLADVFSTNEAGFYYEFKPSRKGQNTLVGSLRFVDSRGFVISGPHRFTYEFEVR